MKLDGTYASPFLKLHCRPRPGRSIMSRDGGQDPSVLLHAAWSHHPRASWIKYSGCYSCCRVGCSKCVGRLWMSGKQFFLRLPSSVNSFVEYSDIRKSYVTSPPLIKEVASKKEIFVDGALSQQGAAQTRCWKEWELWTRGLFAQCRVWPFESLCWKGKSCQHRVHVSASQFVYLQEITLKGIVFGRGQTMWVSPDSCVSKVRTHVSAAQSVCLSESTLKRRYLVKAGLCRFRPIPVLQRLLLNRKRRVKAGLMSIPPDSWVWRKVVSKGNMFRD